MQPVYVLKKVENVWEVTEIWLTWSTSSPSRPCRRPCWGGGSWLGARWWPGSPGYGGTGTFPRLNTAEQQFTSFRLELQIITSDRLQDLLPLLNLVVLLSFLFCFIRIRQERIYLILQTFFRFRGHSGHNWLNCLIFFLSTAKYHMANQNRYDEISPTTELCQDNYEPVFTQPKTYN